MISKIEVALRVRLVEALLIHGEPLVLQDSSIFKEKKLYWQNMSTVASEIARSNDVFDCKFWNYEHTYYAILKHPVSMKQAFSVMVLPNFLFSIYTDNLTPR